MRLALLAFLIIPLLLTGCVSPAQGKRVQSVFGSYGIITTTSLSQSLSNKKNQWVIVDVRPWDAYKEGHIPGATNIPFGSFVEKMRNVSKRQDTVLYCDNASCPLSHEAAKLMIQQGYARAYVLEEGIEGWQTKGLPLTSGDKP